MKARGYQGIMTAIDFEKASVWPRKLEFSIRNHWSLLALENLSWHGSKHFIRMSRVLWQIMVFQLLYKSNIYKSNISLEQVSANQRNQRNYRRLVLILRVLLSFKFCFWLEANVTRYLYLLASNNLTLLFFTHMWLQLKLTNRWLLFTRSVHMRQPRVKS